MPSRDPPEAESSRTRSLRASPTATSAFSFTTAYRVFGAVMASR